MVVWVLVDAEDSADGNEMGWWMRTGDWRFLLHFLYMLCFTMNK